MNDRKECGCKYLETDPYKVVKFTDWTRIEEAIRKIPVLFNENMFSRVIELGVFLPNQKEIEKILKENVSRFNMDMSEIKAKHAKNIYDTMIAIEASHALLIRNHLYRENAYLIECLAKIAATTKEGAVYWEKELLESLSTDNEFTTSLESWKKTDSIKKMVELFHLPSDKISDIGSQVLNENMRSNSPNRNNALKCLEIAKALNFLDIKIDLATCRQIADSFMITANDDDCESIREKWVENAYEIYVFLKENHGLSDADIDKIIEECKNSKKQKAIKMASVSLKFKYKPRGWEKITG